MGLLTLYAGLLLPWLGGTLWLMFVEGRLNVSPVSRVRQAGYGFFVGYAILFLAILTSHKLFESVSWPYLMVLLTLFSASGGLVTWLQRSPVKDPPLVSKTTLSLSMKILTAILLILMVIHLVFIAVEIFTQPVYPWDAWLAWVYRAKAWFLAGSMVEIISPTDWVAASSADVYTIDAWRYPLFPSVIPYWAVLSLGRWSETLVNVPVLFAGSALGMALYGQCREYGLNSALSLVTCYLLFSIPLLGAHLALAGYADIWMAGFAGLGFIALMRGTVMRTDSRTSAYQLTLGLLMIGFGILVKNEGAVWFVAALTMLVLVRFRPRVPTLIFMAAIVVVALGYVLGHTYVEIPMIGKFGLDDGRLVIPFIGSFRLEMHDVWLDYWENFVSLGSWNLLWVAVATSILLGLKSSDTQSAFQVKRVALSFILIFVATQVFIFGFTDQGLWADAYTAINRLPLHFVPALVFAVVMTAEASLTQNGVELGSSASPRLSYATSESGTSPRLHDDHRRSSASPRFRSPVAAALLSAIVVIAGATGFLSRDLPDDPGTTQEYPATDLSFAFGSGIPFKGRMLVDGFANGYALLSSGPVGISANSKRMLAYTWLPSDPNLEAAFFWRRSDDARNVQRTEVTLPGTHLIDLETEPDWQGEIIEFGFLVAGTNGDTIEIGDISLIPDSLGSRLKLTWHAWTSFEEWTQKSINFLYGGYYRQLLSLPVLVAFWLLTAMLLIWLFLRFRKESSYQQFIIFSGVLFLVGWVLLDIRWSVNNVRQIQLSSQAVWQEDANDRSGTELDGETYQYAQKLINGTLGDQPARVLIVGDENADNYNLLKAKYHLLPHSVSVSSGFPQKLGTESLDYVLFSGPPGGIRKIRGWNQTWQSSLVTVDRDAWGTVFQVR